MKKMILLIASFATITACSAGGDGATAEGGTSSFIPSGGVGSIPDGPLSLNLKAGRGFECFSIDLSGVGQIWCRVTGSPDPRLGLSSASFVLYAEDSDSAFTDFEVWDDTICFTGLVAQRPLSRTPGQATYCMGEASLGFNYSTYPLVYSGPPYSDAANGSSDLTYLEQPFVGGDVSMDLMTDTGGTWLVMMDGSGFVSETPYSCTSSAGVADCVTFSVDLN